MTTLLAQNAGILVTRDANRREFVNGGLFVREGVIEQVVPTASCHSRGYHT